MNNKRYDVMKLTGTGGTLRDNVSQEIIFNKGIEKGLDEISETFNTLTSVEEDIVKAILLKNIMKESKGSINPIFINNKINEILKDF